jgi:hypothetical protein
MTQDGSKYRRSSEEEIGMRCVLPRCIALAALILVVFFLEQDSSAQDVSTLKGRYAFTLAEKCVQQLSFGTPGFNDNLELVDPAGAETYSGASDGLMSFDGQGGFSVAEGSRATNIMNREGRPQTEQGEVPAVPSRLLQPILTPIPLGFGLGPAISFSCTGTYSVDSTRPRPIKVEVTCTAIPPQPNVFTASSFTSVFTLEGFLPRTKNSPLVLTDIGNTVQPVTIFLNDGSEVQQQRICTRAVTLVLVSNRP